MKIVIIGKQNHLFWLENIYDGFRKNDCDVKYIATNKQGFYTDVTRNLIKTFSRNSSAKFSANEILKKLNRLNPDVILSISPFLLDESISQIIASIKNCYKIAWVGDRFGQQHKIVADNYDLIYCTDSYFVEEAKSFSFPQTKYLPLAVNDKIFYNRNLSRVDNLLFIGNPTEQRVKIFNTIDSKIKLIGGKWSKVNQKSNIEIVNKNIGVDEVAIEYNKSKFVLNIKHEQNVVNGLNMRTFEAPASKACLIQDYVKDLELNFDIDNEIVVYKNAEDISELLQRTIIDKKRTNKMIENAYLNVYSNHLYKNRAQTILNELK